MSRVATRIVDVDALTAALAEAQRRGKVIVQCHGLFDLVGVEELAHLRAARQMGDLLCVTVLPDSFRFASSDRPRVPEAVRLQVLASLGVIDLLCLSPGVSYADAAAIVRPHIFAVPGDEAAEPGVASPGENEAVLRATGAVVRATRKVAVPATLGCESGYAPAIEAFLAELRSRYTAAEVVAQLQWARNLKVLVVGETILDEYVYCDAMGKSGKEPILIMRYRAKELQAGGVLAIANHLAEFCQEVAVLSCLGDVDRHEEFVRASLSEKVSPHFVTKTGSPTILKRRYLDFYSQGKVFGAYQLNDDPLDATDEAALGAMLDTLLPRYDVVIVADYGHGMLTPRAIDRLVKGARFLAVNTQVNAANIGFHTISKYPRADYVCIREGELRMDRRSQQGDLRALTGATAIRMGCPSFMVTLGRTGTLLYRRGQGFFSCPALALRVVELVGAGDAVLSLTALCEAASLPPDLVSFLGNLAGAQAVETMGNRSSIRRDRLIEDVRGLLGAGQLRKTGTDS
jgi:rfaE bifunctional protein kinase chain/domain